MVKFPWHFVSSTFTPLEADPPSDLDGVRDMANQPPEGEPKRVRDDLNAVLARRPASAF